MSEIKLRDSKKNQLKTFKCVICKENFIGFGNNPYPLKKRGRCCDLCDMLVVRERIKRAVES